MDDRLKVKRLKDDEREKLFKSIHYAYLRHEDLVETSMNPNFVQAKDYIMQGLSYRLNPYEANPNQRDYTINL